MNWLLHVPHRSRSGTLADLAEAARELPQGESRDVARQVALGALVDGTAASAGELIDQIEQATPEQRRQPARRRPRPGHGGVRSRALEAELAVRAVRHRVRPEPRGFENFEGFGQ